MRELFTKIEIRLKKMMMLPFFLFIVSSFFCWASKPYFFYDTDSGIVNEISKKRRHRVYSRGAYSLTTYVYEITIGGKIYETRSTEELDKYGVDDLKNKEVSIKYGTFTLGCSYIVRLTINNENIIAKSTPISTWLFWLCLVLISGLWLLWHFVRYWKGV